MLVFEERGKLEYPEKNLSEQGREPITNSTHIWRRHRFRFWFRRVFVICFINEWLKRSKHGLFVFQSNKTLIWRRHCSIGQSCCSMTSSEVSIDFYKVHGHEVFSSERSFNQPKATRVCVPFDKTIKSLYFRSFVVSVLFARFHFKVIRKSL